LSFKENELTGSDLTQLTPEEIKSDLNVKSLSDRKRLIREIEKLKG
jgi:hypothetical protein